MKKRFLLLCLLISLSHIGSANIIIDLDIKTSYSIPFSISYPCSPSGCNFVLAENSMHWVIIRNSLGEWTSFRMTYGPNEHLQVKEAPYGIPGTGIARPGQACNVYGSSPHLELRNCTTGVVIAGIYFTKSQSGELLNVRLGPNEAGLELFRADPLPPNQAMTIEGGVSHLNSIEGNTADRTIITRQKYSSSSISPNPFSQSLNIQSNAEETETLSLQLLNTKGQSLRTQTYNGGQGEYPFSTENIPPGFYFLQVQVADRTQIHRVVKIE